MEIECNCPACGKTFHEPRSLPCGHVYCSNCIIKMAQGYRDPGSPIKGTTSSCFLCDTAFSLSDGNLEALKISEWHLDLVKTYLNAATFVVPKCQGHPSADAVARCLSGCGYICGVCLLSHHEVIVLRSHNIDKDVKKTKPTMYETACPKHLLPFSQVMLKSDAKNPFMCDSCVAQATKDSGENLRASYEVYLTHCCEQLQESKYNLAKIESILDKEGSNIEDMRARVEKHAFDVKDAASKKFAKARQMIDEEEEKFNQKVERYKIDAQKPFRLYEEYIEIFKNHLSHASKYIDDAIEVCEKEKSPMKLPSAMKIAETTAAKRIYRLHAGFEKLDVVIPTFYVSPIVEIGRQVDIMLEKTKLVCKEKSGQEPLANLFEEQIKTLDMLVDGLTLRDIEKDDLAAICVKLFRAVEELNLWFWMDADGVHYQGDEEATMLVKYAIQMRKMAGRELIDQLMASQVQ